MKLLLNNLNTVTFQKKVVHALFATLIIGILLYVLVLISIIFSVIERKKNLLAIRDLSSGMSTLEVNYLNEVSAVNNTKIESLGFKKVDNANFAVRKTEISSYTVLYAR